MSKFLAPFIDLKMGYLSKEKNISVRRMEFVNLEQYSVMDPLVLYSVSTLQDHVFQVRFIFGYILFSKWINTIGNILRFVRDYGRAMKVWIAKQLHVLIIFTTNFDFPIPIYFAIWCHRPLIIQTKSSVRSNIL